MNVVNVYVPSELQEPGARNMHTVFLKLWPPPLAPFRERPRNWNSSKRERGLHIHLPVCWLREAKRAGTFSRLLSGRVRGAIFLRAISHLS